MSQTALSDIPGISKRTKACFRRAKLFGAHEVLLTPPHELAQALSLTRADVEVLLRQVAKAAAPPLLSTLDILHGNVHAEQAVQIEDESGASSSDSDASAGFVPPTQGYEGNYPGLHNHSDSEESTTSSPDASPAPLVPEFAGTAVVGAGTGVRGDALIDGRKGHVRTSGSLELDRLLNGGFRTCALSELVGESASGKTQLAIQVCVYAALGFTPLSALIEETGTEVELDTVDRETLGGILGGSGCGQGGVGSCYITSDGERSAHAVVRRAVQLAQSAVRERFSRRFPHTSTAAAARQDEWEELERVAVQMAERQVLDNLHVACVSDVEALQHALHYSLPGLLTRLARLPASHHHHHHLPIGVVVVDSLPTLFQQEPATSDLGSLFHRSQALTDIADALKRLSLPASHRPPLTSAADPQQQRHELDGRAVLVLNHVADAFGADKDVARQFVFDTAAAAAATTTTTAGNRRSAARVLPDYPATMGYTAQSAFCSGLLASVPPTLAESIAAAAASSSSSSQSRDGELYVLTPKSAQLGHTWTNCVNTRLFLAQTRGRVTAEAATHRRLVTVRRAAVVFNAFGPSMLDPLLQTPVGGAARKWRREDRQLRFVITPDKAIHALADYTVRNPAPPPPVQTHEESTATQLPSVSVDEEYFTHLDDQDLLEINLDLATDPSGRFIASS